MRGKLYTVPEHGDIRIRRRFIIYQDLPVGESSERQERWLEYCYVIQEYAGAITPYSTIGWRTVAWAEEDPQ